MTIDDVFEQIRNDIKPRSGVKRIDDALTLLVRYGQTDGEHHKQWCIDQVVRILSGKRYAALVPTGEAAAILGEQLRTAVARFAAAEAEADALRAELGIVDPSECAVPPISTILASDTRCVCCGRWLREGEDVAGWYDEDTGEDVVAHHGPCVAADRIITISSSLGARSIAARVIGLWAMHARPEVEYDGALELDFDVTHVPTGLRVQRAFTRREAWTLITRLGPWCSGAMYVDLLPGSEAHEMARQIILGVIAERRTAGVLTAAITENDRG